MVQTFTIAALASVAISAVSVCASPNTENEASEDTAFVLMGTSPRGLSQPGAGAPEFKSDARYCLDHSADTQADPPPEASAAVPFRTFAACIGELGWTPAAEGVETQLVRPHETARRWHGLSSL